MSRGPQVLLHDLLSDKLQRIDVVKFGPGILVVQVESVLSSLFNVRSVSDCLKNVACDRLRHMPY